MLAAGAHQWLAVLAGEEEHARELLEAAIVAVVAGRLRLAEGLAIEAFGAEAVRWHLQDLLIEFAVDDAFDELLPTEETPVPKTKTKTPEMPDLVYALSDAVYLLYGEVPFATVRGQAFSSSDERVLMRLDGFAATEPVVPKIAGVVDPPPLGPPPAPRPKPVYVPGRELMEKAAAKVAAAAKARAKVAADRAAAMDPTERLFRRNVDTWKLLGGSPNLVQSLRGAESEMNRPRLRLKGARLIALWGNLTPDEEAVLREIAGGRVRSALVSAAEAERLRADHKRADEDLGQRFADAGQERLRRPDLPGLVRLIGEGRHQRAREIMDGSEG